MTQQGSYLLVFGSPMPVSLRAQLPDGSRSQWPKWGYIDTNIFTPHSIRSAVSSTALKANIPMDTIMKTAGWSRENTFRKYYQKPVIVSTQLILLITSWMWGIRVYTKYMDKYYDILFIAGIQCHELMLVNCSCDSSQHVHMLVNLLLTKGQTVGLVLFCT